MNKREIKFRGKDLSSGVWRDGYYVEIDGVHFIVPFTSIIESTEGQNSIWKNAEKHEVERGTVVQYIGIKDKNEKEIYDGDNVKVHKFTQELGENLGVVEGEEEFEAIISFSPYGGTTLRRGDDVADALWLYEGGFHEESLELIEN